jgi:hypothetical protein
MLFGIWRALEETRFGRGKVKLFHDKTGRFSWENSRGLEGIGVSGKLGDGTHQGMIIP